MSGGSYNYTYCTVESEYENRMYDVELNELIKDLVPVLKAVEWWQSSDTCEETYRETVREFKKKWFKSRNKRIEEIINESIEATKQELLETFSYLKED